MELNSKKAKILVVDDEPDIHTVLGKFLVKEGFTVASAYSVDEALLSIAKIRPDLIILDLMMPKVPGIEVCNRVKADPNLKDILVLIVSAKDDQSDRIDGLKHGADEYVSKPFHLKTLVRKIEHMLEKKHLEDFEKKIKP